METFLPFALSLVLVPLSLYLLSFIRKVSFHAKKNQPPGSKGWPLLGENIEFALLGPEKFFEKRMKKYSADVFQTSLSGQNMAVFCGAEGNKFLFTNENKLLTIWFPQPMKKALGFPEFMEKSPKEISGPLYRFRHELFKLDGLKDHIPVMDVLAREHFDNYWLTSPNKVVKAHHMMKKLTFETACRLFMNLVDPERLKKLIDPFNQIHQGLFSVPIDFPGTAYNRAIKGSKMVREQIMRIIKERRKELVTMKQNKEIINSTDALSKMLLEDTQDFGDIEICFNIIATLLASYETTSSTICAIMCYLAELPHIYEKVFEEQMEIAKSKGPDELLTLKDIEKMKYSWNVARESLRLTPPGLGGLRETITEFTYAGFTIPKGWKTFWTVFSSHMDPKYFPNPKKFDPSRFEGSGPPPYSFVPFGGGARMCAGKEYARLKILVIMHNVVTRFKLEKVIPNDKLVMRTSATSPTGLPLRLHPHKK